MSTDPIIFPRLRHFTIDFACPAGEPCQLTLDDEPTGHVALPPVDLMPFDTLTWDTEVNTIIEVRCKGTIVYRTNEEVQE